MMKRAYSVLEIKSIDEEKRVIEGIASTPTPDRLGDIVDPMGAVFKLPLPLLWQHDSRQPIGHVEAANVSENGIAVRARFARIDEPGKLKDRLDEAWQSVKAGLVRGLSIGFNSLEDSRIKDTFSFHFLKWEWLELSAVTIPANAEASITAIKSADQLLRAALGAQRKHAVRIDQPSPGASGQTASNARGNTVKTYKEQIKETEASRGAKVARMQALMSAAGEKGETLDEAGSQEYDALKVEVGALDVHLKRLQELDQLNVAAAAPVTEQPGGNEGAPAKIPALSGFRVKANLEPGVRMARYAIALFQGKGNIQDSIAIFQRNKRWMDQTPEIVEVLKTAVAAGDTTTSGWASELVYAQDLQSEFINFLRPLTIIGRIPGFRRVPFNIRVGSQTAGSTAYWVGQGQPVPMSKLTTSSASLGIAKIAGLLAIDDELARSSSPSAELLVRDDLGNQIAQFMDSSFIDPNQGGQTNIQPASVLYGVTPTTPSGTNFAALATDVKAVFSGFISANIDIAPCVWVMSATTALALSLMQTSLGNPQFPSININGGTFMGLPVIVSQGAFISGSPDYGNMIVLIDPREIFLADDGQVTISISNEASIQMLDNPTNASTSGTTATTMISMFQTNTLAIKGVRYVNWAKRRSQAAAFIRTAAYA